jgi:hypothetical protein
MQSERDHAVRNFDRIWERGMLVENFNFDRETERKMERFKEFLIENLSTDCVLPNRQPERVKPKNA